MTDGTAVTVGQAALGIYAVLLMVGGAIGYLKAGSRPSLIAGVTSGLIALVALGLTMMGGKLGYGLGLALAAMMLVVFTLRLRKTGKFMPSGLLLAMSAVMLGLLGYVITRVG